MDVTRKADAPRFLPPAHWGMSALRLQGDTVSDADFAWVGLATFDPAGGAEWEASPMAKIYVVLSGQILVETDTGTARLDPMDSCHIEANERRRVANEGANPATLIVITPNPLKI